MRIRSRGVRADDLAKIYGAVNCMFLLNGWTRYQTATLKTLYWRSRTLNEAFQGLVSSSQPDSHTHPPLPGSSRKTLSLSRQQRAEYLEKALQSRPNNFGVILCGDRVLDDLTRTPLILAEVTTLFLSAFSIPKTKVGVLAAP